MKLDAMSSSKNATPCIQINSFLRKKCVFKLAKVTSHVGEMLKLITKCFKVVNQTYAMSKFHFQVAMTMMRPLPTEIQLLLAKKLLMLSQ